MEEHKTAVDTDLRDDYIRTVPSLPIKNGRTVRIHPIDNGYVVTVGCKTFVFETLEKLLDNLSAYYNNPEHVEMRYTETEQLPIT